ncbi:MAG TPA: DUF2057 family protein [Pseudomonas sp.]|nr:DUF2057 family protein [Pseudomonas sp.]
MRRLFWVALVGLLSGCAQQSHVKLYSGPEVPSVQLLVVEIPDALEVLSINGQAMPAANAGFGTGTRSLHLRPGEYRINAYYKNVFDIDGGLSHEVVRTRSASYHLKGRAGERWKLDYREPANLREAQAMRNSFAGWSVNTRTSERLATSEGPGPVSVVGQLLGAESGPVAPITIEPLAAVPAQTLPHNDAILNTLQQLWRLLDPQSRQAFLEWVRQ